jgi:DNA processing protein
LYPPENRDLADRIAAQGAVISEFRFGMEPSRTTFPMRNRIVSGLCGGVLVVEAGRGSGALITANQAMEQGRIVFAVPGRIDSPPSKGCHDLLKQGARLVDDVDDILDEFRYLIPPERIEQAKALDQRPEVKLSEPEQSIVKALWEGPQNIDTLTRLTGLSIADISMHAMTLEMKRVARMLPGRVLALTDTVKPGS